MDHFRDLLEVKSEASQGRCSAGNDAVVKKQLSLYAISNVPETRDKAFQKSVHAMYDIVQSVMTLCLVGPSLMQGSGNKSAVKMQR